MKSLDQVTGLIFADSNISKFGGVLSMHKLRIGLMGFLILSCDFSQVASTADSGTKEKSGSCIQIMTLAFYNAFSDIYKLTSEMAGFESFSPLQVFQAKEGLSLVADASPGEYPFDDRHLMTRENKAVEKLAYCGVQTYPDGKIVESYGEEAGRRRMVTFLQLLFTDGELANYGSFHPEHLDASYCFQITIDPLVDAKALYVISDDGGQSLAELSIPGQQTRRLLSHKVVGKAPFEGVVGLKGSFTRHPENGIYHFKDLSLIYDRGKMPGTGPDPDRQVALFLNRNSEVEEKKYSQILRSLQLALQSFSNDQEEVNGLKWCTDHDFVTDQCITNPQKNAICESQKSIVLGIGKLSFAVAQNIYPESQVHAPTQLTQLRRFINKVSVTQCHEKSEIARNEVEANSFQKLEAISDLEAVEDQDLYRQGAKFLGWE